MSSEGRLWRCPLCGREYQIPMSIDDPMACPRCMGRPGEAFDATLASRSTMPRSAVTGTSSDPVSGDRNVEAARSEEPDPRVAALHDEHRAPEPWSGETANPNAHFSADRPARSRRRRLIAVSVTAASAIAAIALLFNFRPYPVVSVLLVQPTVRGNPIEVAPLTALVEFGTRMPAGATVEISDGKRQWTYRPDQPAGTRHRLAVIGLRPDREHQIRVEVVSSGGWFVEQSEPLTIRTLPLPTDFPPIETLVSQPERMEPGVTFFAVNRWQEGKRDYDYGYYVMLDETGEVVWYYRAGRGTADLRMLANGNLLCNQSNYRQAFEVDLLGRIVREWHVSGTPGQVDQGSIPVEADSFHHELAELPSGEILALTTELRRLEAFPTSESDPASEPAPADVVGDQVIVFRANGEVTDRIKLFDLLDTQRIGYGSLGNFWKSHYDNHLEDVVSKDWSHANAALYDPRDDSFIVSVRHQDCLVKIDRDSGELKWILGNHDNWGEAWQPYLLEPKGDLEWPYHQHGPQLTPQGTLLLYDNGNYRASPFKFPMPASSSYSRIVEFRVDEENMTVEQLWEYRGGDDEEEDDEVETFYSPFYCEADRQPKTGNILITDGGHIEEEDGTPANEIPSNHQWARIFELTPGESPEKVFEIVIDSGLGSSDGWSVYRSDRLPDVAALSEIATDAIAEMPLPEAPPEADEEETPAPATSEESPPAEEPVDSQEDDLREEESEAP